MVMMLVNNFYGGGAAKFFQQRFSEFWLIQEDVSVGESVIHKPTIKKIGLLGGFDIELWKIKCKYIYKKGSKNSVKKNVLRQK